MQGSSLLIVFSFLVLQTAARDFDWGPFGEVCLVGKEQVYNPADSFDVPWFTIDLDAPAHQRWQEVALTYADKMRAAITTVEMMFGVGGIGDGIIWELLLTLTKGAPDRFKQPYRDEIHAMADLTGIPVEQLALLNIFYEIQKGCTSVVAQDAHGEIYHARNMDFGTLFIWNITAADWQQTMALKDLVVNLEFIRDGKLLFKAVTFAGHLGLFTGVRPGGYSLSTNSRFGSTMSNLFSFFTEGLGEKQFLIYANRDLMTAAATYDEAVNYINNMDTLARGYMILGGTKPGEGAVFTHGYNTTDHIEALDTTKKNGWYVLQTNYDWDKEVLFIDDRRGPGQDCMQRLGQENVNEAGLYQVLSSKPTLNKATVQTSVIHAKTGKLETFRRTCEDPCWFV